MKPRKELQPRWFPGTPHKVGDTFRFTGLAWSSVYGEPCTVVGVEEWERPCEDYIVGFGNPWMTIPFCRSVPTQRLMLATAMHASLRPLDAPWPVTDEQLLAEAKRSPTRPSVAIKYKMQGKQEEHVVGFDEHGNPRWVENDRTRELDVITKAPKSCREALREVGVSGTGQTGAMDTALFTKLMRSVDGYEATPRDWSRPMTTQTDATREIAALTKPIQRKGAA